MNSSGWNTANDSSGTLFWLGNVSTSGANVAHMGCQIRHRWYLDSLRGTNRDQRVEHLRCLDCGEKRTRVWMNLPQQGRPDREYKR